MIGSTTADDLPTTTDPAQATVSTTDDKSEPSLKITVKKSDSMIGYSFVGKDQDFLEEAAYYKTNMTDDHDIIYSPEQQSSGEHLPSEEGQEGGYSNVATTVSFVVDELGRGTLVHLRGTTSQESLDNVEISCPEVDQFPSTAGSPIFISLSPEEKEENNSRNPCQDNISATATQGEEDDTNASILGHIKGFSALEKIESIEDILKEMCESLDVNVSSQDKNQEQSGP